MKKPLLALCLTVLSLVAFAQTADKPITFGVKGGVNLSKIAYNMGSLQDVSYSSDNLKSFHVGAFVDFKVSKTFSIQPALLYSVKGANIRSGSLWSDGYTDVYKKRTINYLHLPVNALVHKQLGKNDLFFGGGPFLSYALSGRSKGTFTVMSQGVKNVIPSDMDVEFTDARPGGIKRIDAGLTAMAGLKLTNGFLVNINYDFGLANTEYRKPEARTRILGLSVGYGF